ncbi:hypothetical protein [Pandoravirus japonicus]|uniref:Uncharacterized protein n=1 Tax=Pandoravirus japonicus TaxID=2823154 RepID=A0A811BLW8_9VIRU|nr:hypothetical protein [Pandoravirus japonicus]
MVRLWAPAVLRGRGKFSKERQRTPLLARTARTSLGSSSARCAKYKSEAIKKGKNRNKLFIKNHFLFFCATKRIQQGRKEKRKTGGEKRIKTGRR